MLENVCHKDSCFVTLTYSDDHLPEGGSLAPKDFQDWLKRFRFAVRPVGIRFYGVGEYGDVTQRPHYHAAIFGYPRCKFGMSCYDLPGRESCCVHCDLIRDTWGRGRVFVGSLEVESAQYIAGYVTKKMTSGDDPRLNGRHPEFARMSRRPGIGVNAMWEVADTLMRFNLDTAQSDVPVTLRHGSRQFPLGRLLRQKLRTMVGKDEKAPPIVPSEEVLAMYERALEVTSAPGMARFRRQVFEELLVKDGDQAVLNMQARQAIFKRIKAL